ncbi:hypothetical protein KR018_009338 [Drosophila ironensis]|nr:hypothetical protein KR018_009338 [Drosophila ironensis]
MDRLSRTFSQQDEILGLQDSFKHEFEIFNSFDGWAAKKRENFDRLTCELLDELTEPGNPETCAESSRCLRERGNMVYRGSTKDLDLVLEASRLYTDAVFAAEDVMPELALAFANRGMALQKYGYYREAYDDCANALECGYPENLVPKVIMRQAHCAYHLQNVEAFEEHLSRLAQMRLSKDMCTQWDNLNKQLQIWKTLRKEDDSTEQEKAGQPLVTILSDAGERGRYMVSNGASARGRILFSERASCFVPIENRLICQQCAATLMSAPIPCPQCHQRVVYCSRKCRESHASIHKYECAAYKKNLLQLLGVSHLALRMVLVYVPLMLPDLRECKSSQEIWDSIMKLVNELVVTQDTPEYLQSLRLVSHLEKASQPELVYHVLCANLLKVYLKEHTDFFSQFESTAASLGDWQVIISALILRSAGQLLVNGHVGNTLLPVGLGKNEFALLQPDIWDKPRHLKLGQLHNLSHSELITAINLPFLSLCNHACAPSICTKFDGCLVVNYARNHIMDHEEIFNCYTRDSQNSLHQERLQPLKDVYKFECKCHVCSRSDRDEDYLKFHRYRCEHNNCRKTFVPSVEGNQSRLNWWLNSENKNAIICTFCNKSQRMEWYNEFLDLVERCVDISIRHQLFFAFESLDHWLVGSHSLKRTMAAEIVSACFEEIDGKQKSQFCFYCPLHLPSLAEGVLMTDFDYTRLESIIRKLLKYTAAQFGDNSLEYISKVTYLWDIIAMKKCQSKPKDNKIFKALLEYLAAEHKEVFLNYYNDFIEQQQCN